MRIDAHQHFWKYDAARYGWITDEMQLLRRDFLPDELTREMDANGIDASVAVQADQSEQETTFLLELAERNARIVGVVGWVDLLSQGLADRLKFFSRFSKLCGFRHIAQAEPDVGFLRREEFVRGVARLAEFGFAYDILIYPQQLPAAIELVSKLPEQRFVVDHLAKPDIRGGKVSAEWAAHIRKIAGHRNVCCKVSGMVTEADWQRWTGADFQPFLDVVFDVFGPERLMFGSDWPVCLVAGSYAQVKAIVEEYVGKRLSASDVEKISGGNAIRFYGLKASLYGLTA